MKSKKRRKFTRMRGTHTHGRGAKKKARGKGHRGGVGMSGSGKRADQKKTLVLVKFGKEYFGKDKTLRRKKLPKLKKINLRDINDKLKEKQGKIDLTGYKILSLGELKRKIVIKASAASKTTIDKIKKADSEIVI